jgi:hypothetical protein
MMNLQQRRKTRLDSMLFTVLVGSALVLAPNLFGVSGGAWAMEWSVRGTINEEVSYDDNVRLESNNETDAFGSLTTPQLFISGRSPTTEIEINPGVRFGVFTGNSSLDFFDQFLDLSATRLLQTGDFGINTSLSREATLESEQTDTGQNSDDGERLGVTSEPFYTFGVTERDRIRLRGDIEKVDYTNSGDDDLDDFSIFGGSVDYEHDLTLRDEVGATVSYRHFTNDDDSREKSDIIGLEGVWRHRPSERLTTEIAPGLRYIWEDNRRAGGGTDSDQQLGGTIRTSVNWQADERTRLRFLASRGLDGSGSGNVVLRDRIGLNVRHEFAERLSFSMKNQYVRNADGTSLGFSDAERDFVRIRPSIDYAITQDWSLSGGYQFRWEDDRDESGTATSNLIFLELSYDTPVWNFD